MKELLTLPNGLRIVLAPSRNAPYAGVAAALATDYEDDGPTGRHHLLEHLMSYAVHPYPTFDALADQLDRYATDGNAESEAGVIFFWLETTRRNVRRCIGLMADIVLRPHFNQLALEREFNRVGEEQNIFDDDASEVAEEQLQTLIFAGHPLARSLGQTDHDLHAVTVADVQRWHRALVCGQRIAIAIAGNFDATNALNEIQRSFSAVRIGRACHLPAFVLTQKAPRVSLVPTTSRSVAIAVGFPTFGFGHHDRFALSVINNHLGGVTRWGSRLDRQLRGSGMAYCTESQVWHYRDVGFIAIQTTVQPTRVAAVLATLTEEFTRLREQRLTNNELETAIRRLKYAARDRQSDGAVQARFYAQQVLVSDRPVMLKQYYRRVNSVSKEHVRRVARSIFAPEHCNVVLVGPLDGIDRHSVITALGLPDMIEEPTGTTDGLLPTTTPSSIS